MKVLAHRDAPFVLNLKSAAGFAFAAITLVGTLLALLGASPDKGQWLAGLAGLGGAILGWLIGGNGSKK